MNDAYEIESKLANAVEKLTPDVFDKILSKCGVIDTGDVGSATVVSPISPNIRTRRSSRMIFAARTAAALAAAFVLLFGGLGVVRQVSDHISRSQVSAILTLDVNPSIGLKLNKLDRVLEVTANNEDALTILDGMDLLDTPADVAVNALIGSMLKFGYIRDNANTVLLSVEDTAGNTNTLLQTNLSESISRQLNVINGAVISQNLKNDESLTSYAAQFGISCGKASLIQKILTDNSHMIFSDLAQLSVNELNLLIGSKQIVAEGMEASGTASDAAYIGVERAADAALLHAGFTGDEILNLDSELDCDDGTMVYDVEFRCGGFEYEYEISAITGDIVKFDRDRESSHDSSYGSIYQGSSDAQHGGEEKRKPQGSVEPQTGRETEDQTQAAADKDSFIGEERAVESALTHAGTQALGGAQVTQAETPIKAELDKDDGKYIYEVEFSRNGIEYDYEIDALTGEVLSFDIED